MGFYVFLNNDGCMINEYDKKICVPKINFGHLYKNEESFILVVTYL